MTAHVELIYDQFCLNAGRARQVLGEAFAKVGIASSWAEWDRESPESPKRARSYGSPTILVNGKDVGGEKPNDGGNCCRVYGDDENGFSGVSSIVALKEKADPRSRQMGTTHNLK